LGVLEQVLCTRLPYGFVGLWSMAVLNVCGQAEICSMAIGHQSEGFLFQQTSPVTLITAYMLILSIGKEWA
jgi:hypothetical protein